MNVKSKLSLAAPFLMLDDSAAGGTSPAAKEEAKDAPNAGGNGGQTQDELNRQFSERAARAAETERKKLWEAIGVKSQEEFDSFVKAKKEAEDAQKSELQKLADKATKEKERADKLEAETKANLDTLQKRIVDGEIKLLASRAVTDKEGAIVRPAFHADVLADIPLLINRDGIKDEDGKIVGVEEALAELAKSKPRLLDDNQIASPSKGPGTPVAAKKPKQQPAESDKKSPSWTL